MTTEPTTQQKDTPMTEQPAALVYHPAPARQFQSAEIKDLVTALAAAQGEMEHASKSKKNDHYKSNYADLPAVIDAMKAPLAKNGLSYSQAVDEDSAGKITLVTTLFHKSGQWLRSYYPVRPTQPTPQGLGSAITFGKRYSLAALCGVAADDEDDDGNAASGVTTQGQPPGQQAPGPQSRPEQPKPQPVFNGEAQLITFQTQVRRDFGQAQTVADLEALAKRDKDVVERLFNSPVDVEQAGAKALAADYNDRLKQLQAAKPKPAAKTVEDVLGGDNLPDLPY